MPETLQKQFDKFCLTCFRDITEQQYIDLRRTFFGGASAMYFQVTGPVAELPDEEAMAALTQYREEIFAFNESVKRGEK